MANNTHDPGKIDVTIVMIFLESEVAAGFKNQKKISQFCAVAISFPTMSTSFKQKNIEIGLLFMEIYKHIF